MAITWPTLEEIQDRFAGWYRTFYPNTSTARGSDAWLEGQAMSKLAYLIQSRIKAVYAAVFVTTATGEDLDRHAAVWMPPDKRRQAATGTTEGQLTFYGTNGTPIPANTRLVGDDGNIYELPTAVVAGDWAAPPVNFVTDVEVRSVSTGQSCNKNVGDTLTLVTPISGIDDEAVVHADLDGARNEETDDELRERLLDWLQYPPGGGNWGHYLNFAQGVGGCAKAYVYPLYRGLGTVDVVCLGTGVTDDEPTGSRFDADENLVWDELDEEVRPATADLDVRPSLGGTGVSDPTAQAETIDIDIDPAAGYEPDQTTSWTAITPCPTSTSLEVTAAPAGLSKGDRLLINIQNGTVWVPMVVTVVSTTTGPPNHLIEIEETLPALVIDVAANGVQPAGPGTEGQVEAILSLFDGLTPGDTSPATRRPVPSPAEPTDLLLADIFDTVQSLASVLNMTITFPAADTTPTAAKYLIRNERIYITYI